MAAASSAPRWAKARAAPATTSINRMTRPMPRAEERRFIGRASRHRPEPRNVGGIILAVAVERRDPGRARRFDAAADRRALAEAPAVADEAQARLLARERRHGRHRFVLG